MEGDRCATGLSVCFFTLIWSLLGIYIKRNTWYQRQNLLRSALFVSIMFTNAPSFIYSHWPPTICTYWATNSGSNLERNGSCSKWQHNHVQSCVPVCAGHAILQLCIFMPSMVNQPADKDFYNMLLHRWLTFFHFYASDCCWSLNFL